jgi:hypothetical protein
MINSLDLESVRLTMDISNYILKTGKELERICKES